MVKLLKLRRSKIQDGRHSLHLEDQFSTYLPKLLVDLSRNLLCSNRTTSGSKWATIVSIGIQAGPHSRHLENQFSTSLPKPLSIWAETCSIATGRPQDRNELQSYRSEIQDGYHSRHLVNLFWTYRKPQCELKKKYYVATGWHVDEK